MPARAGSPSVSPEISLRKGFCCSTKPADSNNRLGHQGRRVWETGTQCFHYPLCYPSFYVFRSPHRRISNNPASNHPTCSNPFQLRLFALPHLLSSSMSPCSTRRDIQSSPASPKMTSPLPRTRNPSESFRLSRPRFTPSDARSSDGNPEGKAPVTILVLDLLDSSFEDFAYIRYSTRKFLLAQPEQLTSPAEMLVVGNQSLDMLQGYTRTRA